MYWALAVVLIICAVILTIGAFVVESKEKFPYVMLAFFCGWGGYASIKEAQYIPNTTAVLHSYGVGVNTLKKANLAGAELRLLVLPGANLSESYCAKASFDGADIRQAKFDGANLENAMLRNTRSVYASFRGANLIGAAMQNGHFERADFTRAELCGASMSNANFRHANLCGADLRGAELWGATLHSSRYDSTTLWPAGFDPRDHGAIRQPE